MNQPLVQFAELLHSSLATGDFVKLVMANHRGGDASLQRVIARRIRLRDDWMLSLLYRYKTRDVTKNFTLDAAVAEVMRSLNTESNGSFGHVHLATRGEAIDLRISKKGQLSLARQPLAANAAQLPEVDPGDPDATPTHDRAKQRMLSLDAPWWQDLGIADGQSRLIPAMSRKWKQINKFVEVLDAAWRESSLARRDDTSRPIRAMDFGAGKGYLSFAVAAHLNDTLGVDAEVTGVELRAELVELCNRSVELRQLRGLSFEQGDVMNHPIGAVDIMIALHACDTATDHAIHKGISAGAQIILCSPCCHKELRPQLRSPGLLRPMLQHGIHLGQQAEMITDSLRALLLEAHGYRTQVFEFVALEHTSKNKMILAVRRDAALPADEVLAQIREIKDFYGVREHCLERLLAEALPMADGSGAMPRR